jgi:hypothetical protein
MSSLRCAALPCPPPRPFGGIIAGMPFRSSNAYYAADVAALVGGVVVALPEEIINALVTCSSTRSSFSVELAQRDVEFPGFRGR